MRHQTMCCLIVFAFSQYTVKKRDVILSAKPIRKTKYNNIWITNDSKQHFWIYVIPNTIKKIIKPSISKMYFFQPNFLCDHMLNCQYWTISTSESKEKQGLLINSSFHQFRKTFPTLVIFKPQEKFHLQ